MRGQARGVHPHPNYPPSRGRGSSSMRQKPHGNMCAEQHSVRGKGKASSWQIKCRTVLGEGQGGVNTGLGGGSVRAGGGGYHCTIILEGSSLMLPAMHAMLGQMLRERVKPVIGAGDGRPRR
jgi:hypothetical protein